MGGYLGLIVTMLIFLGIASVITYIALIAIAIFIDFPVVPMKYTIPKRKW